MCDFLWTASFQKDAVVQLLLTLHRLFWVSLQCAPVLCWPMSWPLQFCPLLPCFPTISDGCVKMWLSEAEVCECVSYMYFTISQTIGAIRLAPCCGPSKRCEIFMIWQPHHAIWWNFPFKTLLSFLRIKQQGHEALKKNRPLTQPELAHFHVLYLWTSQH